MAGEALSSDDMIVTTPPIIAVTTGCGELKTGAPARGERVATYNWLLEIAAATDLPSGLA